MIFSDPKIAPRDFVFLDTYTVKEALKTTVHLKRLELTLRIT
jgi:hypothetical protein